MQTRQDIRADVEQEKALRQKLLADMQILAESEHIRTSPAVEDVDEETTFSFAPVSQKRDLIRFYYQNGARVPNMNGIFVAVPQRWWSADSKRELQDFVRQKALTVLGMAYTVIRMVKIQVTVNPAKVAQLVRLGEELIKCIDNKNVKEKALLTYKGLFRHVSQLDRLKASQAKALDYWVGENFSKSIKKHNDRRQLRLSIETMNYAAKRVKPRLLTVEAASRPIAHLYTDAAGEDFAELNRRLATGERTGFEGHAMFVGGFLALPSGEKKAFKMNVVDVPDGVDKMHIGVLEAEVARSIRTPERKRPPLLEAYFLLKVPHAYKEEFLTADCAPPLIMAYLLVATSRVQFLRVFNQALQFVEKYVSPEQTWVLQHVWPFREAVTQFQALVDHYERVKEQKMATLNQLVVAGANQSGAGGGPPQLIPSTVVDFVMCHCKETDLHWIYNDLRGMLAGAQTFPVNDGKGSLVKTLYSRLFVYEKCPLGQHYQEGLPPPSSTSATHDPVPAAPTVSNMDIIRSFLPQWQAIFDVIVQIPTPDPSFVARGDECSAYLRHVVERYDSDLADFTVFIHSDPFEHMHKQYLSVILKAMEQQTFEEDFLHLNAPKHVKTITPCLQAVSEAIFGTAI
eukprot:g10177.t1